jgi:hypothetical protein
MMMMTKKKKKKDDEEDAKRYDHAPKNTTLYLNIR